MSKFAAAVFLILGGYQRYFVEPPNFPEATFDIAMAVFFLVAVVREKQNE